jgi:hypothetical protein
MNTSTTLFTNEPSFLSSLSGNLQWLLKALVASPAAVPTPVRTATPAVPLAAVNTSAPDLWKLYRLAAATDSVQPSVAAELAKYSQD